MAAAAASLIHFQPLSISRLRYESCAISPHKFPNLNFKACGVPRKGCLKLHYTYREDSQNATIEQPDRLKMLNEAEISTDELSDFERQIQDLFVEVKTKLRNGETDDVKYLLQANFESVKEQIEDGFKGIEQAAIIDIIALGYFGLGDTKFIKQLLHMLDEIVENLPDSGSILDTILIHMGGMYTGLGKFDDSIRVYKKALKFLEKEFGKNSPYLIPSLMGIARCLTLKKKPRESLTFYSRAVNIVEKKKGKESKEIIVPLIGLGNLLINVGEAEEAESCFRRVLEIHKTVYGENDGQTGTAMCTYAHALCAKGDLDQAITMYKKGIKLIEDTKFLASDNEKLEKTRLDLAELLHITGRAQEGREVLEECLRISEKHKGIEHPSSVAHLMNLATSHFRSKNFVEAERLLRTCLHLMLNSAGPTGQAITVPMVHLAVTLYHLNQFEEAERLALDALRIREDTFGSDSVPVGEALDCLVSIQAKLGRDEGELLSKLKRILSIQEREMSGDIENIMNTLRKIIFILEKLGKKNEKLAFKRRLSVLRTKLKNRVIV